MSRRAPKVAVRAAEVAKVAITPRTQLRRIPLQQAVEHLKSHYSAISFPPDVRAINIRFRTSKPLRHNGLEQFLSQYGPGLAFANPSTSFLVTKLNPHVSPNHARKTAESKLKKDTEDAAKKKADEEGREEYIDVEAARATASASSSASASASRSSNLTGAEDKGEPAGITVDYVGKPSKTLLYDDVSAAQVLRQLLTTLDLPLPKELLIGGFEPVGLISPPSESSENAVETESAEKAQTHAA